MTMTPAHDGFTNTAMARDMSDIFGLAYAAAQKATGPEQWERVSDAERMRAIFEQVCRMGAKHLEAHPLIEEVPA